MTLTVEVMVRHPRWGWTIAVTSAVFVGALAGLCSQAARELDRQDLLEDVLQRHAIEAMSLTLDGNLMGAISLLGLIEPVIKQESQGLAEPNSPAVQALLNSVAQSYHAQSVFVVNRDGVVSSSWDDSGKPSTGLQIGFRPYFQTAMRGSDNVYAAVSLSRDERTLYFSSPIFAGQLRTGAPVGAVVARTGMDRVDNLLAASGKTALLLSPQGVVFASTNREWQGQLSGPVTQQRIRDIRALRQFGRQFETRTPHSLPFTVGTGIARVDGVRSAMAAAPVAWNDPAGVWQLVLIEDLSKTVTIGTAVRDGLLAGIAALLLVRLLWRALAGKAAQRQASFQIEQMANEQAARAERKMQLAQAALRMQQADGPDALVRAFLSECHQLFGALQGVVYTAAGDGAPLRLAGSFADARAPASLALGEGLLGQCALERQARVVDTAASAASWTIQSGLGESRPAALLLAPVLLQARLLGVVELALPQRPAAHVLEQFIAVAEVLAINMGFARRSAAESVPV
ncbi:GAF domain-containing protein [Duganella sp. CF402]|uniref:GAF domain-containing protein n=1 Tax=unclassified Duganella TaxID=2636909 RepID=UPI0008D8A0B6|nr:MULTISPECIES: GAF domain-containing protein [unclassified Duganella]RZT03915.1 GAF domain-containing protein [Duganella sp. BK701]SEM55186.1 GAF domain-containing protein [Duganella sp. CF402]